MSLSILHTADWHLGIRTGGQERLGDQVACLRQVMDHCLEYKVDVLLVCGDVLEDPRPQHLAIAITELANLLGPGLAQGMQCVFLAGNHDSAHTFELCAGVQRLLGPHAQDQVRFVAKPTLVPLIKDGETQAGLVALPFPSPGAYPLTASATDLDQKQAELRAAVVGQLDGLLKQAEQTLPEVPKLMAGHFLVSDIPALTGSREVAESEDVRIDTPRLDEFAYVALGHVHKPHQLTERVRYCGALDRIDFGEADEERQVLLVEITGSGDAKVTELPVAATPMAQFEIGVLAEIAEAAQTVAELDRTLVKLTLRLPSGDSASQWMAEAKACFPRLFEPVDIRVLDDPLPSLVTGELELGDTAGTLRAYLDSELEGDPDRDDLMALAEEMLAERAEDGR